MKGIKVAQSGTASHVLLRHPHTTTTTRQGPHDLRTLRPAIPKTSLTPTVHDVPAAI